MPHRIPPNSAGTSKPLGSSLPIQPHPSSAAATSGAVDVLSKFLNPRRYFELASDTLHKLGDSFSGASKLVNNLWARKALEAQIALFGGEKQPMSYWVECLLEHNPSFALLTEAIQVAYRNMTEEEKKSKPNLRGFTKAKPTPPPVKPLKPLT